MSEHTKEPWSVNQYGAVNANGATDVGRNMRIVCVEGFALSTDDAAGRGNRDRIVAAVNALAGIPDPAAFVREARETMRAIAALGGNLPDSMLETRTGPNDAAARGIMFIHARRMSLSFLAKHGGQP